MRILNNLSMLISLTILFLIITVSGIFLTGNTGRVLSYIGIKEPAQPDTTIVDMTLEDSLSIINQAREGWVEIEKSDTLMSMEEYHALLDKFSLADTVRARDTIYKDTTSFTKVPKVEADSSVSMVAKDSSFRATIDMELSSSYTYPPIHELNQDIKINSITIDRLQPPKTKEWYKDWGRGDLKRAGLVAASTATLVLLLVAL